MMIFLLISLIKAPWPGGGLRGSRWGPVGGEVAGWATPSNCPIRKRPGHCPRGCLSSGHQGIGNICYASDICDTHNTNGHLVLAQVATKKIGSLVTIWQLEEQILQTTVACPVLKVLKTWIRKSLRRGFCRILSPTRIRRRFIDIFWLRLTSWKGVLDERKCLSILWS